MDLNISENRDSNEVFWSPAFEILDTLLCHEDESFAK